MQGPGAALRLPVNPLGLILIVADERTRDEELLLADTFEAAQFATLQLEHPAGTDSPAGRTRTRQLTQALLAASDWIAGRPDLAGLPLGVFGHRAGGGAALAAAAQRPTTYRAIVARDGTPHVTGPVLGSIRAATLLVVDGQDLEAIALNQEAMTRVRGIAELEILPGVPGELGEPGLEQQVAWLARRWFMRFLPDARASLDDARAAS